VRPKVRGLVGALLTIVAVTALPAAASACTLAPTGGTVSKSLGSRSYLVNVPSGLTATQVPLLVSLHGFGANGTQQETFTGWTGFAAAKGFIVAYPQGQGSAYSGAWDPYSQTSGDVAFLRDVVRDISASYCVDERRVHVDGWSNGGVMSQRVACAAADVFASATSYGGGTPTAAGFATPCAPSRPISVGLITGQFDFTYGGLAQNTTEWREVDGCGATPTSTTDAHGSTDTYACAGGTTVLARVVSLTSHNWPSGAKGQDQRERMWAFLSANPRP
jgi:polyhydroxybutyrate depolymerase